MKKMFSLAIVVLVVTASTQSSVAQQMGLGEYIEDKVVEIAQELKENPKALDNLRKDLRNPDAQSLMGAVILHDIDEKVFGNNLPIQYRWWNDDEERIDPEWQLKNGEPLNWSHVPGILNNQLQQPGLINPQPVQPGINNPQPWQPQQPVVVHPHPGQGWPQQPLVINPQPQQPWVPQPAQQSLQYQPWVNHPQPQQPWGTNPQPVQPWQLQQPVVVHPHPGQPWLNNPNPQQPIPMRLDLTPVRDPIMKPWTTPGIQPQPATTQPPPPPIVK